MALEQRDIEGKYVIRSETSDGGPYKINGDGITEIRDGRTSRTDANGYKWESVFTVTGKGTVHLASTVDPSASHEDNFIKDNKNNLTREKVTYKGDLTASEVKGKLVLAGEIKAGIVTTRLTLTKV